MSKADGLEFQLLNLIFAAKAIANIADNAAASPSTSIWVSLHTADPGDAGAQNTSEVSYSPYARIAVARTTGGFAVSSAAGTISPVAAITFASATSTSTGTITHAGFGLSSAGAGTLLYSGTVTPNINFGQNVQPRLTTASVISED